MANKISDNDNAREMGTFPPICEVKVCLDVQETPGGEGGGGGGRLAVPDLIKEILTGGGDTENQGRTEKKTRGHSNSIVRLRISQFERGCLSLSADKHVAEETNNNSDN